MKIKRTSTCLWMVSGMLLFTGGALQAQVGGGSSLGGSGGAVGQGSPDITRPGTGGDATRGGAGTPQGSSGSMKPGHESSGTMGSEGAIIKPGPGGDSGRIRETTRFKHNESWCERRKRIRPGKRLWRHGFIGGHGVIRGDRIGRRDGIIRRRERRRTVGAW